jgi:tellurite resistance protein
MNAHDKSILRSLVAIAWADGKLDGSEQKLIDDLLAAFDADASEEADLRAYARTRRSLADVPLGELDDDDRELLLANAAVITHADGEQSAQEKRVLDELIALLGFSAERAKPVLESARDGSLRVGTRGLLDA